MLTGEEAHHAARVLRLGVGDAIQLFDGQGTSWQGRVVAVRRQRVEVAIKDRTRLSRPSLEVTIAQSVLPSASMDWLVTKLTELGVTAIAPLVAIQGAVRLDDRRQIQKQAHWRKVALSACKQSGRAFIPEILPPRRIADLAMDSEAFQHIWMADPHAPIHSLSQALAACSPPSRIMVFIGPEGGWTAEERRHLSKPFIRPVALGPHILRSETAALFVMSLLAYRSTPPSQRP